MKYLYHIIGLILFITVLELCARTDDYITWNAPFFGSYTSNNLRMKDHLGSRCRPNSQFEKWVINTDGFRGKELSKYKTNKETSRVIVVGASESFGLYETAGMEFPSQLQSLLNDDYQILNGSCPGMTLRTITEYFNNILLDYKPDIIFIYPTPHLYLDEDIKAKPPVKVIQTRENIISKNHINNYSLDLRLPNKIYNLAKKLIPEPIISYIKKHKIKKSISKNHKQWIWNKTPNERLDIFKYQLKTLIDTIHKNNVSIILATHASRFNNSKTIADKEIIALRSFYPRATNEALIGLEVDANTFIRSFKTKENIWISDIDLNVSGYAENFIDFSHFSNKGAHAVSETIKKTLNLLRKEKNNPLSLHSKFK